MWAYLFETPCSNHYTCFVSVLMKTCSLLSQGDEQRLGVDLGGLSLGFE